MTEAKGFLDQVLPYIDKLLSTGRFLCGNEITLADTIALPYFHAQEVTSLSLDAYPSIQHWYREMKARPAFQRTLARMPQ